MLILLFLKQQQQQTYSNDDEGSSTIQYSKCSHIKHNSIEEDGKGGAEKDTDETPERQPQGTGRENKHQNKYGRQRVQGQLDVTPKCRLNFPVEDFVTAVQHWHLTEIKNNVQAQCNNALCSLI